MRKVLYHEIQDGRVSTGLLLLRLVAGTAFMMHGWGKIGSPMGWMGPDAPIHGVFQALAAIAEFGGGLAWILGLLTPLVSLGILCTMAVAATTHVMKGDPFMGGYELATVYFTVALLLLLAGPGRYSLDALFFRSREPRAATGVTRTAPHRA